MRLANRTYIKVLFIICVVFQIGLMAFAHVVYPDNEVEVRVYGNFLIEIAVTVYAIFLSKFKLRMPSYDRVLISVFFVSQIMAFLCTSLQYGIVHFDIHKLFMCIGVMYACYYMAYKVECPPDALNWILNATLYIGVIATIYNIITNINIFLIGMGDVSKMMLHTWSFTSFFPVRAAYGSFLVICALITLFKLEQRNKILFIALYFWFVGNTIILTARSQCLAIIIGSVIYMVYAKKYRKYVVFGIAVLLVYIVFSGISHFENVVDTYYMFFDHSRGKETDLSTGRLEMWLIALNNMDLFDWVVGNGFGAQHAVMDVLGVIVLDIKMASFHNGYISLLFEAGILGIYIWIRCIKKAMQCVRISCPAHQKHLFFAILAAMGVLWCFDSLCLIFTTDTLSISATFYLITLPISVANYYKNLGR